MADIPLAMRSSDQLPIIKKHLAGTEPPEHGKGLRFASYQGPILCGDQIAIDYNLKKLEEWAGACKAQGAQLLAVGELFLCGYNIQKADRENVSKSKEEVLELLKPIATKHSIALVVPYAESIEGDTKMYDSMMLVDKDGTLLDNYRKSQLWGDGEKDVWNYPCTGPAEKDKAYTVHEVNGIKVGLLNCYEAEFPELSRILALKGAEIILIPTAADVGVFDGSKWSCWGYPDVAKTCITVNAYHNHVFCAYINHSLWQFRSDGKTLSGIYLGNSTVADPMGQTMVIAENVETMLVVDMCPSKYYVTHPEGQSNFITDRRPELYSQLTSMSVTLQDGSTYDYPKDPNA